MGLKRTQALHIQRFLFCDLKLYLFVWSVLSSSKPLLFLDRFLVLLLHGDVFEQLLFVLDDILLLLLLLLWLLNIYLLSHPRFIYIAIITQFVPPKYLFRSIFMLFIGDIIMIETDKSKNP